MSRQVVVTGGAKGIGRAIAEAFLAAGDRVVITGRDAAALATLPGGRAEVCDVGDERAVSSLFDRVEPVDVLVNNAGVSSSAPLARTSVADWQAAMSANAVGAFLCTRALVDDMRARGDGRIVTVASTAGLVGTRYTAAYAASKHAALGVMQVAAAELAGSGATANAVCPSFVRSEMTARAVARIAEKTGRSEAESEDALARSSPLGRLIEPEEVAAAVVFLASAAAAPINGQSLILDGGGLQR